ncbi:hypothetical protein N9O56_01005 [Rickettsiales bacterium]|nr:hypothetical protein [Rickettsiales bacterium]
MRKFLIYFSFLAHFLLFFSNNSFAAIGFDINNDDLPKSKILIYGFNVEDVRIKKDVEKILLQIKENLLSTNLFEIIDSNNYLKYFEARKQNFPNPEDLMLAIDKIPDFDKYLSSGIDSILIVDFRFNEVESRLESKIRLWDILDERQLFGKYYTSAYDRYKKMSNLVSNEIFKSLTGEKIGHFDTQILYVAESGNPRNRRKRIAIMDFDGENHYYLTDGADLVLTPIFSGKKQEIIFLRYFRDKPQLFYLDLDNKFISKLSNVKETTFAPAAHPLNSDLLLFSVIESGNANIFEMNRYNNRVTKITSRRGINTTPSYSPDGNKIAFSSDRYGSEKIYVMNYDGSNVKKISKGGGSYSKPIWSPDGSLIAFTKIQANRFYIGVMAPDGSSERTISSGYLVEGAKWSPNSRYLIYSKKKSPYGKSSIPKLYISDIITGYERMLNTPKMEGATDPDWGLNWQD